MKNFGSKLLDWWVLIALGAFVLLSLGGGCSTEPQRAQTPEEIHAEIQDDAREAYEEQNYRGY